MKEFGPTRFERLSQGAGVRDQMLVENLHSWTPTKRIESADQNSPEISPFPLIKRLPPPVRRAIWAGLTLAGLTSVGATCFGDGGDKKEEQPEGEISQPTVERTIGPEFEISSKRFLELPFPKDPQMKIQQGWLFENGIEHKGVDYIKGTLDRSSTWQLFAVLAAADGNACANPPRRVGNAVFIEHQVADGKFYTYYGHLSEINSQIPPCSGKDRHLVKQGERIGTSGDTGIPGLVHLHFEVKDQDDKSTDPYDLRAKRSEYPDPNLINGKVCGENYLWVNCPTKKVVEAKTIPLPHPATEPLKYINVLKESLARCRVSAESTQASEDFWGGWTVKAERDDYWVDSLGARIILRSPEGIIVKIIEFAGETAPANVPTWVVGYEKGGLGYPQVNPLYSGEGSRVATIEFQLTGASWESVVDKMENYKIESNITAHKLINPFRIAEGFGRHEIDFQIVNNGNLAFKNLVVFGFLYNQQGELVDMVWSGEKKDVAAGESMEIRAPSLSQTGRCVGKIDPAGYNLEYFVSFQGVNEDWLGIYKVATIQ